MKLSNKLQMWIMIAQLDNFGHISAFKYAANTVANLPDSSWRRVYKSERGFTKLLQAYFAQE